LRFFTFGNTRAGMLSGVYVPGRERQATVPRDFLIDPHGTNVSVLQIKTFCERGPEPGGIWIELDFGDIVRKYPRVLSTSQGV
jgi:hypothetical protein